MLFVLGVNDSIAAKSCARSDVKFCARPRNVNTTAPKSAGPSSSTAVRAICLARFMTSGSIAVYASSMTIVTKRRLSTAFETTSMGASRTHGADGTTDRGTFDRRERDNRLWLAALEDGEVGGDKAAHRPAILAQDGDVELDDVDAAAKSGI